MSDNLLDTPAGSLIKTTLVDFPGRVASTIFLEGCNLRCPYCYNTSLVLGTQKSSDSPSKENNFNRDYKCSTLREIGRASCRERV